MRDTEQNGLSASLEISKDRLQSLGEIAQQVRHDVVAMIQGAKSGHQGPSLYLVEILVSLYFDRMNHRPEGSASARSNTEGYRRPLTWGDVS